MREMLKLGGTLMLYSLSVGVALAYVNLQTQPRIAANKVIAGNLAREEVLPDMTGGYERIESPDGFVYWVGYSDTARNEIGGYIVIACGKGYSSVIETMLSVDVDFTIRGIKILSQQETPGLGSKVEEIAPGSREPWFTAQFKGRTAPSMQLAKDGGALDSITGATISSRAVTGSIRHELEQLQAIVEGQV